MEDQRDLCVAMTEKPAASKDSDASAFQRVVGYFLGHEKPKDAPKVPTRKPKATPRPSRKSDKGQSR